MKNILCRVAENRALWAHLTAIRVDVPELAQTIRPGQFVTARDPTTLDPYLRRALFPVQVEGSRVQLALPSSDPLARRAQRGALIDLVAPLGNALEIDANARHVLLVADGVHAAPIVFIARRLIAQAREVVVVARGNSDEILPAYFLPPEIEYQILSDAEPRLNPDWLRWADALVASAEWEAYAPLAREIAAARYRLTRGFAFVLANLPMPCGIGDCGACAVETAPGIALACRAGPFFDLADLRQERA